MKNNPCWNCPKRKTHCAIGCPDWTTHKEQKLLEYEHNAIAAASQRATFSDAKFKRLQDERTARMKKGH